MKISVLMEYDADIAEQMGTLLKDLSSHYEGEPVRREVIEDIIESPWHDIIVMMDGEKLVAMASVSVIMGALIDKNLYLEDFVVSHEYQHQGIGTKMFEAIMAWGQRKGCHRLEFTSSGKGKKAGAVKFYQKMGAEIRDTNSFRIEL
jgi:GNAT superfamily N-acetyltransferase